MVGTSPYRRLLEMPLLTSSLRPAATPSEPSPGKGRTPVRTRVVGLVLVGLGAFALVAALAVRVFLVGDVVKLPLDQESEPTAVASDMDWYAIGTATQHRGEQGTINQRVLGDPTAPDADEDTAVWSSGTVIKAEDGTLFNASEYRVCLDRHTAAALTDCDSAETGEGVGAPEGL